jgi:NAD(P)-dependent dehydrogenase (short-subunit alcohol dehydrogenase family)
MEIQGKTIVITGGAHGIGKALALCFKNQGAKAIALIDIEKDALGITAEAIGAEAYRVDLRDEAAFKNAIDETYEKFGSIDLFCSNAGVGMGDGPSWDVAGASNDDWQTAWDINVMAHVYASRALVPHWRKQGHGYMLITASAAGLLNQIGDAAYSTTKHAVIGFAESLAITHGVDGVKVSVLCPQAVDTRMIADIKGGAQDVDGIMPPDVLAKKTIEGLQDESFLILPHGEVEGYRQLKTSDYDRWISGMQQLRAKIIETKGKPL